MACPRGGTPESWENAGGCDWVCLRDTQEGFPAEATENRALQTAPWLSGWEEERGILLLDERSSQSQKILQEHPSSFIYHSCPCHTHFHAVPQTPQASPTPGVLHWLFPLPASLFVNSLAATWARGPPRLRSSL